MNFLILALVIRTAYQGKLFQIMQANLKHSEPQTLAEMERQGYKFHAMEFYSELASNSLKIEIVVGCIPFDAVWFAVFFYCLTFFCGAVLVFVDT